MRKYETEEERVAARKASQAKYKASTHGKVAIRKYSTSPRAKAKREEYRLSKRGRELNAARRRSSKHKAVVSERLHVTKVKYILKLGGECMNCELKYNDKNACVFHFHHRDPATKSGNITLGKSDKWLDIEVKKCDLLCANCHAIHHSEEY